MFEFVYFEADFLFRRLGDPWYNKRKMSGEKRPGAGKYRKIREESALLIRLYGKENQIIPGRRAARRAEVIR